MSTPMHKQKRYSWSSNSTWILLLLMSVLMWQCEKDTFEGETISVCPEVTSSDPANGATNVMTNKIITATFNEAMVSATINGETFTVKLGTIPVSGIVTYADSIATFTPAKPLEANKTYTGNISKQVKDPAGNYPLENYTWSFSTGNVPTVISTDPVTAASNVPLNKLITATFSTVMDPSTINAATFLVNQGTNQIAGTITYSGNTATFTPTDPLTDNTVYSGTITIGAKDAVGNAMASQYAWSFSTAQTQFTIILSSNPAEGGSTSGGGGFNNDDQITVLATPVTGYTFTNWTEGTNIVSSNSSYTFTVTANRTLVANFTLILVTTYTLDVISVNGTVVQNPNQVNYDQGTTVQLTATPNSGYKFNFWSGAATSSSNQITVLMDQNKTITANYSLLSTSGPASVNLGSVGDFAIIAGSGVSNTGVTTMINGDVGSFPTATINGLLPGNVNGTLYTTADPIVGLAKTALTTAYNDAQSRSLEAVSLPGQIGGLTLAPGLYVNSSTSGISGTGTNGILTLDAGGNANAVWIFKMGSTFVTDSGTSIVLAGGAQADNIYWSVGTSATLGTNSVFYGNILADQAITLTTGATLFGRALTRIAAVTLDSNTVTKP